MRSRVPDSGAARGSIHCRANHARRPQRRNLNEKCCCNLIFRSAGGRVFQLASGQPTSRTNISLYSTAVASSSGVDRCLRRARRMTRQRVRVREGRIGSRHPREASTAGISTRGKRCASHTSVYFLSPPPTTNVPSFFSSIFARDPRCHTRTRGRTKRSDGCEYEYS